MNRTVGAKEADELFCTWSQYWLEVIARPAVRQSTYGNYRRIVHKHLIPAFGDCYLRQMTQQIIQAQLSSWQKYLATGTVQILFRILKSILKQARLRGMCGDPFMNITLSSKSKRPRILTLKEQRKMEKEAIVSDQIEFLVCLYTGLRVGEICALRWEDINWAQRRVSVSLGVQRLSVNGRSVLTVGLPKSDSSIREIPVPNFILDKLRLMKKKKSDNGYIFSLRPDKPCDPRAMQARFSRLSTRLGIAGAHMHTLRHTYATRCLEKQVRFEVLSELLGHSSPRITIDYYSHCTEEEKEKSVCRLKLLA